MNINQKDNSVCANEMSQIDEGIGSGQSSGRIPRRTIVVTVVIAALVLSSLGYLVCLNGNSIDFTDTEVRIVVSGSMDGEPRDYPIRTIPTGSMVFIHKVDGPDFYDSFKVGDVMTFHYTHPVSKEDMVVTHRIIDITESQGVYTYTLKGDAIADDPTNGSTQVVTSDSGDVIGKVVGVSHVLGESAIFLSTWTGRFCLIVIPCILLIIYEIGNIVRVLRMKDEIDDRRD